MKSEKTLTHIETCKVRFNEVDSLGIVWHGHYIVYFEDGREAFGKKHGISYLDVKKNGFVTPIVKTSTEHFLPLKYGETFTVETTFVSSEAAKMIFRFQIFNEERKLVCSGETVQVFLDQNDQLCLYNPPFFQEWKKKVGLL